MEILEDRGDVFTEGTGGETGGRVLDVQESEGEAGAVINVGS